MTAIQPELLASESVLWTGQPSPSVIFHRQDGLLIPFSFLWGGFAIFWESLATGHGPASHGNPAPWFFTLWGLPFVVIGQYLIWGRFLYAAWLKRRTFYAVTNKRVIAVQNGFIRRTTSSNVDSLPLLIKEENSNGAGNLRFAPTQPAWSNRGWGAWNQLSLTDTPAFVDITDLDTVYQLVSGLRDGHRK